jgi:hypothetical protein
MWRSEGRKVRFYYVDNVSFARDCWFSLYILTTNTPACWLNDIHILILTDVSD